jgi:hypothetical protein
MRPTSIKSLRLVFGRAAATLAFVAQLALMAAALGEGKAGIGLASHVDPAGTSTHYAHDEAVCAACQARSLHGAVRLPQAPAVASLPKQSTVIDRLESYFDSSVERQHLSRAPPFAS